MSQKLDLYDKKLLYELQLNGRASYSELGSFVKLSKQAVKHRIEKMEQSGIIKQYFALIDIQKLGYTFYRLDISLQNVNEQKEKEIRDYALQLPKVIWVAETHGMWDLSILFLSKNLVEVDDTMKWLYFIIILVALTACSDNIGGQAARTTDKSSGFGSTLTIPDLVVSEVLYAVNTTTNSTVYFNITISNMGIGSSGPSKARFFYRDPNNLAMGSYEQVPKLMPGSSYNFVKSFHVDVPGGWYVQVKADYFGEVKEADENNNIFDLNFDVFGENTSPVMCFDSDGGHVYDVFGFTNGTLINGSSFFFEDYCSHPNRLIEQVCGASDWPMISPHNCTNCTAGRCI